MRTYLPLSALLVLLLSYSANAVDRVYTFVEPAEFETSIFGFSGTITTDGSLGTFSDTSFIKDWSLTLFTPAGDGDSMEMFTSATGEIEFNFNGGLELLSVTETDISFLNSGSNEPANFRIGDLVQAYLFYLSPAQFTGRVRVIDASDAISDTVLFGDLSALPIATGGVAVPEPGTALLGGLAFAGLLFRRRRN